MTDTPCAVKQRLEGIMIPNCPPVDEQVIQGPQQYYLWALASRENYKGTYDCMFGDQN